MKIFLIFLFVASLVNANATEEIVDGIINVVRRPTSISPCLVDASQISKAGKLSKVSVEMLQSAKWKENIDHLMELAAKEHRLSFYSDQFKYAKEYKKMTNGDKLLLKCLKESSCNLEKYTKKIQNTYISDKYTTSIYTIKGFINDTKMHRFVDGYGKPFYAKISEVVDLKRTIKMPYIGSIYRNSNAAGYKRDAVDFWKKYSSLYPEVLSKNNIARINGKLSPIVDKQWIKYNPKHKSFLGETIEHHHLNNTDITVGIPKSLHRGQNNKDLMHVD